MLTDTEKLAQIAAILETPSAPAELKAYERPELQQGECVIDGKTHNGDGSIWYTNPQNGAVERIVFGYVSPVKTPDVWTHGKAVLGDAFSIWEAGWKKNPYGVYKVDLSKLLRDGTEVNTMLFSYIMVAAETVVQ